MPLSQTDRNHPRLGLVGHTAYKIDTLVSLGVIVTVLALAIIVSLLRPKKAELQVGHVPGTTPEHP